MPHYRSEIRAGFRAALAASDRFADFEQIGLWSKSIDAKSLPVIAVGIPRETCQRVSLDATDRNTTVHVVLKRLGSSGLEDLLDDDSAEIERAVMAAFDPGSVDLTETGLAEDGSGEQRVATLTMTFVVPTFQSDPLT